MLIFRSSIAPSLASIRSRKPPDDVIESAKRGLKYLIALTCNRLDMIALQRLSYHPSV
jgi:hypothetical protein